MIHLNVILTTKDEQRVSEVRSLLAEQARLSRQEPGCARFEVYHSKEDPRTFLLHEWWESEEALDAHRKAQAYTELYKPKVLPLVERVPHPSTLVS